jgi:hypothetical protein
MLHRCGHHYTGVDAAGTRLRLGSRDYGVAGGRHYTQVGGEF